MKFLTWAQKVAIKQLDEDMEEAKKSGNEARETDAMANCMRLWNRTLNFLTASLYSGACSDLSYIFQRAWSRHITHIINAEAMSLATTLCLQMQLSLTPQLFDTAHFVDTSVVENKVEEECCLRVLLSPTASV